jgi:hypothetical protein
MSVSTRKPEMRLPIWVIELNRSRGKALRQRAQQYRDGERDQQTTHGIVFDWQHWAASAGIPREDFRNSSSRSHSNFFGTYDIVAHPQLSREMKLSLLRQWEQTARSLSVAESEGMGGGEENMLGRVELAIALVEKQP